MISHLKTNIFTTRTSQQKCLPSDIWVLCTRTVLWTASFQFCQKEWGDVLRPVKLKHLKLNSKSILYAMT